MPAKRLLLRGQTLVITYLLMVCGSQSVSSQSITLGAATLHLGPQTRLDIKGTHGNIVFSGVLGQTLPHKGYTVNTTGTGLHEVVTVTWHGNATLQLSQNLALDSNGACHNIRWTALAGLPQFTDCVDMHHASWFGGAETRHQDWPLGKYQMNMSPYVAYESIHNLYGAVTERLFFSSAGVGINIPEYVPLHVSINASGSNNICLKAAFQSPPYRRVNQSPLALNYVVCRQSDTRAIHRFAYDKFIRDRPTAIPNEDVFRYPIWSTWAEFKANINQNLTLSFADAIKSHGFKLAQLEIDDNWTPHYGDFDFDKKKFPDAKAMITTLHSHGIKVTVWVHPFKNTDSVAFQYGSKNGLFIKDVTGTKVALAKWWAGSGIAGVVDFTNPAATSWYLGEMKHLQTTYGVDSFKFDAGEADFLPNAYKPFNNFANPDNFTTIYARVAASADTSQRRQEVRTGKQNQRLPVLVRMDDKLSTWTYDQGLKTVIPTALVFGILGYPFVLPDMVGGNAYGPNPDRELFIRWAQVSALLPTVQFSIGPWKYDQQVITICRDLMALHEHYGNLIIELAHNATKTGDPIVRPLWWIAPNDTAALGVDQQFLLGDNLMVAPVTDKGVKAINIYLPTGKWHDEIHNKVINGPQWLDYMVTLTDLPRFLRVH